MASHRGTPSAGGYARGRYRDGLRSWRKRLRLYTTLMLGPFLLAGVAGGIAAGNPLSWAFGMLFGLGAGAWVAIRDSPPAYIENWQTGAEGEQKTARVLDALDQSRWTVLHDIDSGHGNFDHVAIGPAGVFLLDSKNPVADAYVRGGELWLRRRHDPGADWPERRSRKAALTGAARLHDQLAALTATAPWVNAVTVLWCPFPEGVHETDLHSIVEGKRIAAWLEARPDTQSSETVGRLANAATQLACGTPLRGSSSRDHAALAASRQRTTTAPARTRARSA